MLNFNKTSFLPKNTHSELLDLSKFYPPNSPTFQHWLIPSVLLPSNSLRTWSFSHDLYLHIFPTCSWLITSFFPQSFHSLSQRFCEVLPPKFSLPGHYRVHYFACKIVILSPSDYINFYPQLFCCTILIKSFLPQKCAFCPLNITLGFSSKMPYR